MISSNKIFQGVAAKYLSEVDANPKKSNQHEIGGLVKVGFKKYLGEPQGSETHVFNAKMLYLDEESELSEIIEAQLSWYDARGNNPNRSAEYRLYYPSNQVTEQMSPGDFFAIAKLQNNELLVVICKANSTYERQLKYLFGLDEISANFSKGQLDAKKLPLPLIYLLEDIGYQFEFDQDGHYLNQIFSKFGDQSFPTTEQFSAFTRELSEVSISDNPDICVTEWMELEEVLFRTLEKHFVAQKLAQGFGSPQEQVDNFISYSLSVQNRRKARAGLAFEKHLGEIFKHHNLKFEQGSSKLFTENRKKPDFLFPSFAAYHDDSFNNEELRLLGAKTTCKDRWRQVLSEAEKIKKKHLITLEAAISNNQIEEMFANNLQLVVPQTIQATYDQQSLDKLINLENFIQEIKSIQSSPI